RNRVHAERRTLTLNPLPQPETVDFLNLCSPFPPGKGASGIGREVGLPGSSCSDECSPRAGCISSERERRPGQYSSRPLRPLPERKGLSELEKSTASRSGRRAPIRFLLCRAAPAVPYPALR